MWTLRHQDGTVLVEGARVEDLPPGFVHDDRVGWPRGPGHLYAAVVLRARETGVALDDRARAWGPLDDLRLLARREPRPYQAEALEAWVRAGRRGIVVLPTGAGKTFVAELAIARTRRPTLVVAPTLDLVGQWHDRLRASFGVPVGILGGGHHEIEDLTVATYDSARLACGRWAPRFALVVFDEAHHLPAPGNRAAAEAALAPFRLGLTATPERDDGLHETLDEVLGPVVYRRGIRELAGRWLADYDTVRLEVELTAEERARYEAARARYLAFLSSRRIAVSTPQGWQRFIQLAARSRAGREALAAFREARRIQHGTERKLDLLATLLAEERGRRTIVFTDDNATAYRVSREFLVPCITHRTDVRERRRWLALFESGDLPVLVTSRVLNEGVDLPAAEVAIVLSGTGTVREHVQRLGRILRPGDGKRAVLYEVVAAGTAEVRTSERRRRHDAYR